MRRLTAVVLVGFAILAGSRPAIAVETGTIKGRVLNETSGRPQAGVRVRLARINRSEERVTRTFATTDRGGRYVFSELPTGSDYSYALGARFQGGLFAGPPITIPDDTAAPPVITTKLRVWDTITDPAALAIERNAIFLVTRDAEIAVLESVKVTNATDHAYIGRGGGEHGRLGAPTLGFALPPGVDRDQVSIEDSDLPVLGPMKTSFGFAATIAIPPGTTQTTFSYPLPGSGGSFDVSRTALYSIRDLVVHATSPLRIESNRLTRDGEVAIEGREYQRWAADQPLDPGDQIQIVAIADAGTGAGLVAGVSVVGAAVVISGVVFLLRRRPRQQAPIEPTRDDLLVTIAELDAQHDAGRLADEEWAARRSQIKARILKIKEPAG